MPAPSRGLPAALTTFIGRGSETAEVTQLLRQWRMVSITGLGGVGKTRLLHRVATGLPEFPDQVAVVDLAAIGQGDVDRVARVIGDALGMQERDLRGAQALVEFVHDRDLILCVDNGERLGAAAVLLEHLLEAAPGLRILAASREPLGVLHEYVFPLQSLSESDAVALFVHRAAMVSERWDEVLDGAAMSDRERAAVQRLSVITGGLPMAIELAAGDLDARAAPELVERLEAEGRFSVLPGLRAMLDWSRDHLDDDARAMWAATSAFAGSFDLAGAQMVSSRLGIPPDDVPQLLEQLARRSLLRVTELRGQRWYRQVETIREYGAGQLVPTEKARAELRRTHADYLCEVARQGAAAWVGPDQLDWMQRLADYEPDLVEALDFCLSQPDLRRQGLRLAIDVARSTFHLFAGRIDTAREMLERALDACDGEPTTDHVDALALSAWLGLVQARGSAHALLRQAEELAATLGVAYSSGFLARAQGTEAWLYETRLPHTQRALDHLGRSEALLRSQSPEHDSDAFFSLLLLALAAGFVADRATSRALAERVLHEATARRARWSIAWAHLAQGLAELEQDALPGDPRAGVRLLQQALRVFLHIGDAWGPVWGLWMLAILLVVAGYSYRAAQLIGGAARQEEINKVSIIDLPQFARVQDRIVGQALAALTPEDFQRAWTAGHGMDVGDVLALALTPVDDTVIVEPDPLPAGVTRRQMRVLELVAQGLSDKEIATLLDISAKTINTHLRNISTALGVRGRGRLAAWFKDHRPRAAATPSEVPGATAPGGPGPT